MPETGRFITGRWDVRQEGGLRLRRLRPPGFEKVPTVQKTAGYERVGGSLHMLRRNGLLLLLLRLRLGLRLWEGSLNRRLVDRWEGFYDITDAERRYR